MEPDFNSGLRSIIADSSGHYYAVGGGSFAFLRHGWYVKLDNAGNIQFYAQLSERDDNFLNHIIRSADQNFLICGYNAFCDVLPQNQGIVNKVSSTGTIMWSSPVNADDSSANDNKLQHIYEMRSGKLIAHADSTVYLLSDSGALLLKKEFGNTIIGIGEDVTGNFLVAIGAEIYVVDTTGSIVNQIPFSDSLSHLSVLADSTLLVMSGSNLMKLDSAYDIISQYDLSAINYPVNKLWPGPDKIVITGEAGTHFAIFDHNLLLADTFSVPELPVQVSAVASMDSQIVVAGAELNRRDYNFLKSYASDGQFEYNDVDLQLSEISFDSTYGFHLDGHPPEVLSAGFVARIEINNTGTQAINSFNINCQSAITYGPCGYFEYIKRISNITLLPGQSMSIVLDTLHEYGVITNLPFTYTFCAWVSNPDSMVDKNQSNDYLCESFTVDYIVGMEPEKDLGSELVIYPIPASSQISIQYLPELYGAEIRVLNVVNQVLQTGRLIDLPQRIELNLVPGAYWMVVATKEKTYCHKLIIKE